MSAISKEQLMEILQHRISFASEFPESEKAQIDLELARIALASLELERGMIRRFDLDMSGCDSCGQDCGADMVEDLDGEYVLWDEVLPHLYRYGEYTATPAPVSVPDAATAIRACMDEFPESVRDVVEECASIAENACRAAMLQGAEPVSQTYKLNELSGNSPVTPGGWISCSDRMPEDTKMLLAFSQGENVAAYWNWVVNPIDYKKYRAFTYLSGNILDDVTHWMPLPEPPL